ncbi:MAG: FAD-linked oxidase C-terminal domain-containing protein [Nitrososphaeria archaeon]
MIEEALREIASVVGSENVFVDNANLRIFQYGAVDKCRGRPSAIIRVVEREQVSRVMKIAYKYGIPVVPRGGGSSVTGAVVPIRGELVLDLRALNRIRVDVENGIVEAEAGATVLDVDNECRKHGFFFPPDPGSARVATIGGALAENSGGMRGARYGVMRDWVLKIEVVLADGTVTYFGEATYKNRVGYDLLGLIVGSEGTLGIITKAWLKIMPLPEKIVRIAGFFKSLDDAGEAIFRIRREGINPLILEFVDRWGLEAANKVKGLSYPELDGGMVLVDVDGPSKGLETVVERVKRIMKECNAAEVIVSDTSQKMEEILEVRRVAFTAPGRLFPGFIDGDIAVPLSKIKDALIGLDKIRKKYGVFMAITGHAGDGNLHPNIGADPNNEEEWKRAERAAYEVNLLALELGGTVAAEHGIGKLKEGVFLKQLEIREQMPVYRLMKEIKRIFDPKNILNPGKYALE